MDRKIQALRRRAQAGDLNSAAQILRERIRFGELTYRDVQLAAYLGHSLAKFLNFEPIILEAVPFNYNNFIIGDNPVDRVIAVLSDEDFAQVGEEFLRHAWSEAKNPPPFMEAPNPPGDQEFEERSEKAFEIVNQKLNLDQKEEDFWENFYHSEEFLRFGREKALKLNNNEDIISIIDTEKDAMHASYFTEVAFSETRDVPWRWALLAYLNVFFEELSSSFQKTLSRVEFCSYCRETVNIGYINSVPQKRELRWQKKFLRDYLIS